MLGFEGVGVLLAYLLSIGAMLLCVVYGVKNWNIPSDEDVKKEIDEEIKWEQSDPEDEGR